MRSMTTIRHMAITAYRDWLWAASTSSVELCASRASTTMRRYPPPGASSYTTQRVVASTTTRVTTLSE